MDEMEEYRNKIETRRGERRQKNDRRESVACVKGKGFIDPGVAIGLILALLTIGAIMFEK